MSPPHDSHKQAGYSSLPIPLLAINEVVMVMANACTASAPCDIVCTDFTVHECVSSRDDLCGTPVACGLVGTCLCISLPLDVLRPKSMPFFRGAFSCQPPTAHVPVSCQRVNGGVLGIRYLRCPGPCTCHCGVSVGRRRTARGQDAVEGLGQAVLGPPNRLFHPSFTGGRCCNTMQRNQKGGDQQTERAQLCVGPATTVRLVTLRAGFTLRRGTGAALQIRFGREASGPWGPVSSPESCLAPVWHQH